VKVALQAPEAAWAAQPRRAYLPTGTEALPMNPVLGRQAVRRAVVSIDRHRSPGVRAHDARPG